MSFVLRPFDNSASKRGGKGSNLRIEHSCKNRVTADKLDSTFTSIQVVSARACRDNTLLATDKAACAPQFAASLISVLGNQTEQPMRFVSDPGCEVNAVS